MKSRSTPHDELCLTEAAELLADVRFETETCAQTNLFDFARLLSDLVILGKHQTAEDASQVGLSSLSDFISQGIHEVRVAMAADHPCFERIDMLSDQAIEEWGEQLAAIRDGTESQADAAWEFQSDSCDERAAAGADTEETDEPDAPSADDIQALLSQIGADSSTSVASRSVVDSLSASSSQAIIDIDSLDPELREAYLDDASSCLGSMENSLLKLESNLQDAESLNQILRELHTLKGASASVGLTPLADQIHDLEDTLRDDQASGRAPSIDSLLKIVDQIRAQITGNNSTSSLEVHANPAPESPAIEKQRPGATPVFSDDGPDDDLVRVKSSQLNRLMDMLAELVMLRNQRETELLELQEIYHELITSVSKMRLLSNESDLRAESSKSLQASEIASDVLETAQHLRDCTRPFADGNAAVSRFIRQFRQELVELRRTPISGLFRRLQRVVRDAAQTESKHVRLAMVGEDAGIERALQQRLYEPLLHIVRNSVCHGIESPTERSRSGKAQEGVVSLEARSGPDLFVIEVRDDGRGLNYEAIRQRGVERGLLAKDQAVNRKELSQLIFHPGFSTRDSANQVGGRGVGMDVVAATLQRMRGWLEVESEPGAGTRVRLSFPRPSVVQHAMVFRCADQLFALPMESVQAAGEVSSGIAQANFSRLLGLDTRHASDLVQAIVVANEHDVLEAGKPSPLALLVDEIFGPEELVVRPLPWLLRNHPFCVGASLSGMGQTVILLDARRVLQSQAALADTSLQNANRTVPSDTREISHKDGEAADKLPASARSRVLVVDDSLSARKRVVRSLKRYPLDIVEVADGKEALELLNKERFAAVFSDMEMPNVDGMELLTEIHAPDRSDPPPVVIISTRSESEFTERARQLGAADYLIKPLADEALDAALLGIEPLRHLATDSTLIQLENGQ